MSASRWYRWLNGWPRDVLPPAALATVYGCLFARLHHATMLLLVCAPLAFAVLVAFARRPVTAFGVLAAFTLVPPALMFATLAAHRPGPHEHPCNPAPFLALFWLLAAVLQVCAMGVVAGLLRWLRGTLSRRRRPSRRGQATRGGQST